MYDYIIGLKAGNFFFRKKFFSTDSARDPCTLASLKIKLGRRRISGDVKKDFESHEDLAITVGNAAILQALFNYFDMKDVDDTPSINLIPGDVSDLSPDLKLKLFSDHFRAFVKSILKFHDSKEAPRKDVLLINTVSGTDNPDYSMLSNVLDTLKLREAKMQVNDTTFDVKRLPATDDLNCYFANMLNWVLHLFMQKAVVKAGDGDLNVIQCKRFLSFFLSHSMYSNYAVECIDYILKCNVILSPKLAERVKFAFVVNTSGLPNKNKESDLMKENLNKLSKQLIKNLKANKSDSSIQRVTGSAKGLQDIVSNIDSSLNCTQASGKHKIPTMYTDVITVLNEFHRHKVSTFTPLRKLWSFKDFPCNPFTNLDATYKARVMSVARRLAKGQTMQYEEGDM